LARDATVTTTGSLSVHAETATAIAAVFDLAPAYDQHVFAQTAQAVASALVVTISRIYDRFTPPTEAWVPPVLPQGDPAQTRLGHKLFRHYRNRYEGRNVFIYSNNTVSEVDPDGTSTLWRESDRTADTLPNAPHVVVAIWGGHEPPALTNAQLILLATAGYEVLP
jgi:hypothetical protein